MPKTLAERLSVKYRVTSTGCWEWTAAKRNGYGTIHTGSVKDGTKRMSMAHRVMYEQTTGVEIPDGLEIDHLCMNKVCVNPDHLEAVTPRVNKLRADGFAGLNARKTLCVRGHLFDEENTRIEYRGRRRCRTCDEITRRARRAIARAATLTPKEN